MIYLIRVVAIVLVLTSGSVMAQTQLRFEAEIRAFETADKTTPPPRNAIVFTGSSSIRLWEDLASYFPNKTILQRGFGGSEISDVIRYADQVIVAYRPKQVVLYAGENDIATGKQTGKQTFDRFVSLFEYVRQKLPSTTFTFISIKPSPSRRQYFPENDIANQLIKAYLSKQKNTQFVDVRPVMLGQNGQPIPALFKSDSLHMLPAGYERWATVLGPYLK